MGTQWGTRQSHSKRETKKTSQVNVERGLDRSGVRNGNRRDQVCGGASTRSHNKHSIELKLKLPPGHFGLLKPLNQQAKKGITVSGGVKDPDYHGEIGLLLHSGGKEDYVWMQETL
jgi:dUTPase